MNNVFKLIGCNASSSKRKLMALCVYIIKLERSDTINRAAQLKVYVKKEASTPKRSRWKE